MDHSVDLSVFGVRLWPVALNEMEDLFLLGDADEFTIYINQIDNYPTLNINLKKYCSMAERFL